MSGLSFHKSDLDEFDANQISKSPTFTSTAPHLCLPVSCVPRASSSPFLQLPLQHVQQHLGDLYSLAATPNAKLCFRFYEVALTTSHSAKAFATEVAK
jgi:hypothetical protein